MATETITVSSSRDVHLFPVGTVLRLGGLPVLVVSVSGCTLTVRGLWWWERAWRWMKLYWEWLGMKA